MVRGTFSPARAWRLAVGPASTRTLGSAMQTMRRPSKISASRRGLNSHEAAQPREHPRLPRQARWRQLMRAQVGGGSASNENDEEPQYHIEPPHCVRGSGVQSVRGAAAPGTAAFVLAHVGRRLECVACHGCQRGAGGTCSGPVRVTGPWRALRRHASGAALPNPSLKRSANGRSPGPGRRYGVHFRQPGPGALPLSPA